jgi:predicted MFS family arabinose efflux permease
VPVVAVVITLLALGHFTLYTYFSPLLLDHGITGTNVGTVLVGYGCGGLLGLATDAATALVNATTNVGIAGGALLGSVALRVIGVSQLGWVGAGLVASSLVLIVIWSGRWARHRDVPRR